MRTGSMSSSPKAPRPEPSTSPMCGRKVVCDSTKAAADSARVNRSDVIAERFSFCTFVSLGVKQMRQPLRTQRITTRLTSAPHVGHQVKITGAVTNAKIHNLKEDAKDAAKDTGIKRAIPSVVTSNPPTCRRS